jgi:hypothetical protein
MMAMRMARLRAKLRMSQTDQESRIEAGLFALLMWFVKGSFLFCFFSLVAVAAVVLGGEGKGEGDCGGDGDGDGDWEGEGVVRSA